MDYGVSLLLSCIRKDITEAAIRELSGLTDRGWDRLLQASLNHGLTPLLYHRIKPFFAACSVPTDVQQHLKEIYFHSAARNMRIYKELADILRCFSDAGIPVILLKGAHLAEIVYGNIALRPMADVDLLVKQADLMRAHVVLNGLGYAAPEKDMGYALGHLPPYGKKNSIILVEIHYNIVSAPFSQRFPVEDLWARAQPGSLQGVEVLTLCPEDLLLHLCVHTGIYHGLDNGIMPFVDISRTIEHYQREIDWQQAVSRARQWGLSRCVYLMLSVSKKIAGLSVPEHILPAMKPDCHDADALASAEALVFEQATPVASDIARLFTRGSFSGKLISCIREAFPPQEIMKAIHPLAASPFSLYAQYFFRITGLFKRHGKNALLLLLRDKEMQDFAHIENRRNALKDWMLMDP